MAYKRKQSILTTEGGTGLATLTTAYAPVISGTTATGNLQRASTGLGTSGFVLTSTGAASLPTFQHYPGVLTINGNSGSVTGTSITLTGSTNGASYSGASSTMTKSMNYLKLPSTTSVNGLIKINSNRFMHSFNSSTNAFAGVNAGRLSVATGTNDVGIGSNSLVALTSSSNTTAAGSASCPSLTTGVEQTAVGVSCINSGTSTAKSAAIGFSCLQNSTTGNGQNAAIGASAGISVNTGDFNTIAGKSACPTLTSGTKNVALGQSALNVTTGGSNIALGVSAGNSLTSSEASNIILNATATVATSNVLRVGAGTGTGSRQLKKAFISGIQGITVTGAAVLVSATDQLGVVSSSAKLKENIVDIKDESSAILDLKVAQFTYIDGEDKTVQTGLIAEDVAKLIPRLVMNNKDDSAMTVKYHDLPVLILNELKKAMQRIEILESQLG